MTNELEKLRDYLHAENPALDTLEGVVADIVLKDRSVRDILIKLCIRTGVLQSFILEGTHDLLFISHCKTKLVNDHFFSETAAGKAIAYCKFLTQKKVELIPFRIDGKWGFMDELGNNIIPCKYETVSHFENGCIWVKFNGKWKIVDRKGKESASLFDVIADVGTISVLDPQFIGRRANETCEYIMLRSHDGEVMFVRLIEGTPSGANCFEIIQVQQTEDYGEIKAGTVYFKAFTLVAEEED